MDEKVVEESDGKGTSGNLLRGLFMLLFFVAARVVGVLVAAIAIFQFIIVFINKKPDDKLKEFGDDLSLYAEDIILYMSYNTENRPWPFSDWRKGGSSDIS
jgi:hypothetical protein